MEGIADVLQRLGLPIVQPISHAQDAVLARGQCAQNHIHVHLRHTSSGRREIYPIFCAKFYPYSVPAGAAQRRRGPTLFITIYVLYCILLYIHIYEYICIAC